MQTRHIGGAPYFTKAQLEASNPSRRDGIDAVAEARWRSTTSKIVKAAIKALKLPDWVYETSMNYINRFFLTRSISKNDRHLVVGGAILLASKVQESPRSVQDVAYVLLQLKDANKQKTQQRPDQNTLDLFMEGVVLAEQAMLFSLNFNLNVETHVSLARRLLEPLDLWAKANPAPEEAEPNQLKLSLYAAVMFFLNDSALTNLSLQYPNSKIAPVALVMAAKRIVAARYAAKEVPAMLQRVLSLATDTEWFASKGLTPEAATDIEAQINELYATSPAQPTAAAQQRQQQSAAAPQQQAQSQAGAPQSGEPQLQAGPSTVPSVRGGNQQTAPIAAVGTACGRESNPAAGPQGGEAPGRVPGGPAAAASGHRGPASPRAYEQVSGAAAAGLTPQQCGGLGQPSSSAAAPTLLGATAEGTPELPHPPSPQHPASQEQHRQNLHPRACKRLSDGDDCTAGDQQATSELHAAPYTQADPEAPQGRCPPEASVACGDGDEVCNGNDDSAPEDCSPDGLTTGNASGSGCGVADGQPEVCSRPDGSCCQQLSSRPSEPQLAKGPSICHGAQLQPQQCAKRSRAALGGEHGCGDAAVAPFLKARRLGDAGAVAMEPSALPSVS